jgi:hypothetical protein
MPERPQLMDRLAAANPVSPYEPPTAAERSEAAALLARIVATPVEQAPPPRGRAAHRPGHSPRRPGRSPRRVGLIAAVAACLVLGAIVAVDLLDSSRSGPSVVERAVAATSSADSIYHVVQRTTVRVRTPDRSALDAFDFEDVDFFEESDTLTESWIEPGGRTRVMRFEADGGRRGRLLFESAGDGRVFRVYDASSDRITVLRSRRAIGKRKVRPPRPPELSLPRIDPTQDLGPQLRALHRQGRLTLAGRSEVRGRSAYRLASDTVRGSERGHRERLEFLVDAETYLPLRQRSFSRQMGVPGLPANLRPPKRFYDIPVTTIATTDFLRYERLPRTAETLAELKLGPHPGAKRFP